MTPISIASPDTINHSRCWLPAGHDGVRLERALARRHEPGDDDKVGSIGQTGSMIAAPRRVRCEVRGLAGNWLRRPRRRNLHRAR